MNSNPVSLVNAFLGTKGAGNCLIGPYRPFGMVRVGPDSLFPNSNNGYQPGDTIQGFSHLHVSGTGGAPRYGHILLMPFCGRPQTNAIHPFFSVPYGNNTNAKPVDVEAKVGSFSCGFTKLGTSVKLTCTRHAGFHRYIFSGSGERNVLVDTGAALQGTIAPAGAVSIVQQWDSTTQCIGGYLQVNGPAEVYGRSDFRGGWGHDKPYSVYYHIHSRTPFSKVNLAQAGGLVPGGMDAAAAGAGCRVLLSYGDQTNSVELVVGISFVSIAQARQHVEQEVGTASLEEIRESCEAEWKGWLNRFRIQGGTDDQQVIFYSMLYRLLSMPTDLGVDNENPFWHAGVRQFTDWYCLWDSIRNANSLFHLFAPEFSVDTMNALLDIADHTGWLPDAHIAGHHAFQQSACAAEILFSEAAAKGLTGVDYSKALSYCRKNGETISPDVLVKGRYIDDYSQKGYLSTNVPKASVSRFLEYAYHDWCIARLAGFCGSHDVAARYGAASQQVWNMWRADKKMFWPRRPDGTWEEPVDPYRTIEDGWNDPFTYEGPLVSWSLNPLHDLHGLITRMGGNELFVNHLDWYFAQGFYQVKETRMHIPHLYTYAGRPDKAADCVRKTLNDSFRNAPDGLSDNEDMGCQSAYFICNAMGIYPVYGQTHYLLVPPVFDRIEVDYGETGDCLIITADRGATAGRYINAVMLNGKALNRAWIEHSEIARGGLLAFVLGDTPTDFGTSELPPNGLKNG